MTTIVAVLPQERIDALTAEVQDLTAQRDRLREQISESHLNTRVVELVNECTRHETEARAARAEVLELNLTVNALRKELSYALDLKKRPTG